jgi:putative flippase GtrA
LWQSQFIRFALVGALATALQFALLLAMVEILAVAEVPASALAFSLSAMANYWLNYHFTFASQQQHQHTLPKFLLVAALGLGINTSSFSILLSGFHYMVAQAGATLVTLACNFLLHKLWIYRSPI